MRRVEGWVKTWTELAGHPLAVLASIALVVAWLAATPLVPDGFHNQVWQLAINSTTTVITFILVFVIQSTQNRSDRALHTKVDAIAEALERLDDGPFVGLEERSDEDIKDVQQQVRRRT